MCENVVGKAAVLHNFIVADIVDKVIIEVDFLSNQGIKIDMKNRIITYRNMEVPLLFGYDNKYKVRRVITTESRQIAPNSEAVIWAEKDGTYGTNKWWIVEPTKLTYRRNPDYDKTR